MYIEISRTFYLHFRNLFCFQHNTYKYTLHLFPSIICSWRSASPSLFRARGSRPGDLTVAGLQLQVPSRLVTYIRGKPSRNKYWIHAVRRWLKLCFWKYALGFWSVRCCNYWWHLIRVLCALCLAPLLSLLHMHMVFLLVGNWRLLLVVPDQHWYFLEPINQRRVMYAPHFSLFVVFPFVWFST